MDPEEAFHWAEEAVGFVVRSVRPDLVYKWRGVTPGDIGIKADDWLKMSKRMVDRFNSTSHLQVALAEPARRPFRTKRFINFAIAIADEAS